MEITKNRGSSKCVVPSVKLWLVDVQEVGYPAGVDISKFAWMQEWSKNGMLRYTLFKIIFAAQSVKFIRVTAKNNLCPPGHSGAGKPGWIFADEIVVE